MSTDDNSLLWWMVREARRLHRIEEDWSIIRLYLKGYRQGWRDYALFGR